MERLISRKIAVSMIFGVFIMAIIISLIVLSSNVSAAAPCRSGEYRLPEYCQEINGAGIVSDSDCDDYCTGEGYESGHSGGSMVHDCGCVCQSLSGCNTCGNSSEKFCSERNLSECEKYAHNAFSCMLYNLFGDEICIDSSFEACANNCESNTPKIPPKVESIVILPDYAKLEKTNLGYEEVFPLKPYANLTISGDEEEYTVSYILSQTDASSTTILEQKEITCGKNCIINFPYETKKINQDVLLIADVSAKGLCGEFDNVGGIGRAERYTPYFNLKLTKIEAGNVLLGKDTDIHLVEHKPIAVIGSYDIESRLRTADGRIEEYIDYAKDIKFNLYVDNDFSKPAKSIIKDKVERIIDFKPGLLAGDRNNPNPELLRAARETKTGNRTINFVGIFPKEGAKESKFLISIDTRNTAGELIEDTNYGDNVVNGIWKILGQQDDNFRIGNGEFRLYRKYYVKEEVDGKMEEVARFQVWSKNVNYENKENSKRALKGLMSAFPLDPGKVEIGDFISSGFEFDPFTDVNSGKSVVWLAVNTQRRALGKLQRFAETEDYDLMYGAFNSQVVNRDSKITTKGITMPSFYDRAVLINEGPGMGLRDPGGNTASTYMHEAGHLFVEDYRTWLSKEQEACGGISQDVGLPSSYGWCMDQKTGKSCEGSRMNGEGIHMNIWAEESRDADGCYSIIDQPWPGEESARISTGFMSLDMMTSSGSQAIVIWPRDNPTYNKLMKKFLVW